MSKFRTIRKYTYLGISAVVFGFILYQSAIPPVTSKNWENKATDVWASVLNDGLKLKESVNFVEPEDVSIYSYDSIIPGYNVGEYPIGYKMMLDGSVTPYEASNNSVTFSSNENVVIDQHANSVGVTCVNKGHASVKAASVMNNSLIDTYDFEIVDKIAPLIDNITGNTIKVFKGKSLLLDEILLKGHEASLYDFSDIEYSVIGDPIGEIRGSYFKALDTGSTIVEIKRGFSSVVVDILVEDTSETIVNATSFDLDETINLEIYHCYNASDHKLNVSWNRETPTDRNIMWSGVCDSNFHISSDGDISLNYLPKNVSELEYVVRATSVDNPSLFKDCTIKFSHIIPGTISLSTDLKKSSNNHYLINTGKTAEFNISVDKFSSFDNYELVVDDKDVISANFTYHGIHVVGLSEGSASLLVKSIYNGEVKSEKIDIDVITRGYINDSNRDDFSYKVRKYFSGHACLFLISAVFLTLFLYLTFDGKIKDYASLLCISSIGGGIIFAGISEFIQLFVPGRTATMKDVGIDLLGYAIGFAIVLVAIIIKNAIRNKRNKEIVNSTK